MEDYLELFKYHEKDTLDLYGKFDEHKTFE